MTVSKILPAMFFAIAIVLPGMTSNIVAETAKEQDTTYVDLDGDGCNDNATDRNADGIPDATDRETAENSSAVSEATGFVNFDAGFSNPTVAPRNTSEKFARLSFTTRALCTNRGGFGAGDNFGPGNGIGIGALSAGGCSGGVCRP
ncbi:MAG: hypothetical protein JW763_02500 [candidate division Zixibacteria bacterium]|nr:hypothetical protein [candidate division Zixibacteria bacterium]